MTDVTNYLGIKIDLDRDQELSEQEKEIKSEGFPSVAFLLLLMMIWILLLPTILR